MPVHSGYVLKPVTLDGLKKAIERAMSQKHEVKKRRFWEEPSPS